MSTLRKMTVLPFVAATLLAGTAYLSPSTFAQRNQSVDENKHAQRRSADAEHRRPARFGRLPGAHLFRPLPSDQGPLAPDEQQELLDFLSQQAPGVRKALDRLERKDPQNFGERLQRAAPLLRRLQRIFGRDPELGRNVIKHTENLHRLRRARQAWLDSKQDRVTRRQIEELMRRTLAENVEIEAAVLDDQLLELDWQREARIEAEFQRLTSSDTDLAGESPELRKLVRSLNAAQTTSERDWLEDELWVICAARMDREVKAVQRRVEQMRTNTADEVDRRMKRLTAPAGKSDNRRHGKRKPKP